MSEEKRERLIEQLTLERPALADFLKNQSGDLMAGLWDMVSLSFQLGFEALWDAVNSQANGKLMLRPLLSICRQSIELSLKAARISVKGPLPKSKTHKLTEYFAELDQFALEKGLEPIELDREVESLIREIQEFDEEATRFRFPEDKRNTAFEGFDVDLDKLFQAHWIIISWCEGTVHELGTQRGVGTREA